MLNNARKTIFKLRISDLIVFKSKKQDARKMINPLSVSCFLFEH